MKKDPLFDTGVCSLEARENDTVVASRTKDGRTAVGVFSLKGRPARTPVPLADGTYRELLSGAGITVRNGAVAAAGEPLIFLVG